MICVVIKGPNPEDILEQMSSSLAYADLVELRLDYFNILDIEFLKTLRLKFSIPMIFTLRSKAQGGNYMHSEQKRICDIRNLLTLNPEYIDLEVHLSALIIDEIRTCSPSTKLILSYHNFEETPHHLEEIYLTMRKISANFYKIAVMSKSCLDALRLMCWIKEKQDSKVIAISMGIHGQMSRILSPFLGSPITYASLEESDASQLGQLSAKTLTDRYQHQRINKHTAIFGLIGDPVEQSISDETHNRVFQDLGLGAIYVKIQVRVPELSTFLQFAKQLPFRGLSVTMPLKEAILPFLDKIDLKAQTIGAVNTVFFNNHKLIGFNTDGIGALDLIERVCCIKDKRVLIIGAGGVAKAIAHEISHRNGKVIMGNRNKERAIAISKYLGCVGIGLAEIKNIFEDGYDIVINATSVDSPIDSAHILSNVIAMDVKTKPKETLFLQQARAKGCKIIYGYEMFIAQALYQFAIWFSDNFDQDQGNTSLKKWSHRAIN